MYVLRLFKESDPFTAIESRALGEGELTIGRGDDVDWKIEDPERTLSRRHCVLTVEGAAVTLRDTSANGVFLGVGRERAPAEAAQALAGSEMIRLGDFMIVLERAAVAAEGGGALAGPFANPILAEINLGPQAATVPTSWADAQERTPLPSDGSLLDAFCYGAKLDASQFAGEDPAEVMRRLGALYQQMVLGLEDLMGERTNLKSDYSMDRTRVGMCENNPFKWMSGQRLAVDLLHTGRAGFLSGPEAVSASFADLKKHILCVFSGMSAAIKEVLEAVSPEAVTEASRGQANLFGKTQAQWKEYGRRHNQLSREAMDDPDGALNRAFVTGYKARLDDLDRKQARS